MLTQTLSLAESAPRGVKDCKIINGTRLYYEIKGEGQPIIFIHGFTLDNRMWDNQFHFFSKQFRCIRFDLRGYGQSSLPGTQPYTYQEDIKSLLQSLEISEPVILVGHSIGGQAALNFALRYPHFTKALVLIDAQIEGYNFRQFDLEPLFNQAKRKTIEFARRKWLNHELFIPAKRNKIIAECLDEMLQFYSGWHFVSENPLVPLTPSPWNELEKLDTPTLIMYGDQDLPDFIDMNESAASRIAGAKKVVVTDAGHVSNMESPVFVNHELEVFFDSVTAD